MSTREAGQQSAPIRGRDDLAEWLSVGCKPPAEWRIGTENEKFPFYRKDLSPVPYGGDAGIRALLEGLMARYDWQPIIENDNIIALKRPSAVGGGNISLEPAGQFELSGAPLSDLHATERELCEHLRQIRAVGDALGIGFLALGGCPTWRREDLPTMPKDRYGIMTRYMPKVGTRGLDMMYRTATVQVNLDFADEADMVKKLRVSLALQPLASAIFASSPFTEGRPNGMRSMRSEIWRHTDADRSGMLAFAFEDGMGFERYVDYALDVPMYFVYRDGTYLDVAGASFRDFLDGRLEALPGELPSLDDWSDHLTTLFPEVRLKRFLEMRGADAQLTPGIVALSAFWVGLLYDADALDAAWDCVKSWSRQERQDLRDQVPKHALMAPFRGGTLQDVAKRVLDISRHGLQRRACMDAAGNDESRHLDAIEPIVTEGRTVADELLARFAGDWKGDISRVFGERAF